MYLRRKMRMKILMTTILMSLCTSAYSDCYPGYCAGIGAQVVVTASVTTTGVLFQVPAATAASLGCTLISGGFIQLLNTHPQFKEIYATYLTAIATNSYFSIAVDGSATCTVAYIRTWNN